MKRELIPGLGGLALAIVTSAGCQGKAAPPPPAAPPAVTVAPVVQQDVPVYK